MSALQFSPLSRASQASHPQHVLQRPQSSGLYLVQIHASFVNIFGHRKHSRLSSLGLGLQDMSELLEEVIT